MDVELHLVKYNPAIMNQPAIIQSQYAQRRLWLIVVMTVLGGVIGFVWGQQVGIMQEKAAMLKMLEIQLNEPSLKRPLPL